jgi:hypothetical protein
MFKIYEINKENRIMSNVTTFNPQDQPKMNSTTNKNSGSALPLHVLIIGGA